MFPQKKKKELDHQFGPMLVEIGFEMMEQLKGTSSNSLKQINWIVGYYYTWLPIIINYLTIIIIHY